MIGRFVRLARKLSLRELMRNPRGELGRVLDWMGRKLQRVAHDTVQGPAPVMPAWLRDEMHAQAMLEPDLLGEHGSPDRFAYYRVPHLVKPGEVYRRLVQAVGMAPCSHVMTVPWLVRGGADRGALLHLQAWVEVLPAERVVLLLTEPAPSTWLDRVPEGVRIIRFGEIVSELTPEDQVRLLTRLLVQMQPAVVHNINSPAAWQAIESFGLALRQHTSLFASLFCDDHDANGVPVGHARRYLRSCHSHLSRVFCDNTVYPGIWARELGVPADLFRVLKFPLSRPITRKAGPFLLPAAGRILWAGRFDRQKRPDLLLAIARRLPDVEFDVHGVMDVGHPHPAVEQLKGLPNVTLRGPFSQFGDIVSDAHAALLFTTEWEGLPTLLLDAAACGVPIVAPAVGGIGDLIESDWLVQDLEDVDAFTTRLRQLLADRTLREVRRQRQYEALSQDRSWPAFSDAVSAVERYLLGPDGSHPIQQQGNAT
ncbi:glycosyltransferase [Stenotrophomonas sp.]|uniref:glycosyltransferase family 4 protein n=1 Tax=Stenotrophomonas sp. TaxID=69392 RepID=UPI0028AAC702|nr:glycosyltransferase [Stenotrophomonas sp.]